jgi:hypothetical protein
VGVAENPPVAGGAGLERGGAASKKAFYRAKIGHPMTSMALPLLNLLTVGVKTPQNSQPAGSGIKKNKKKIKKSNIFLNTVLK